MNIIARTTKQYFSKPSTIFLVLSLTFGFLYFLFFPPMTAPDEVGHFAKAYAFTEGKVIPEFKDNTDSPYKTWNKYGFYLPEGIKKINDSATGIGYNPNLKYDYSLINSDDFKKTNKVFIPVGGQLNYSFLQYLPQIVGITVGKFFKLPIISIYYLARLSNLLLYITAIFLGIKLMVIGKWAYFLLALNPMSLELASSTSGDGFTNAISFLFVALLSRLIYDSKLDKKKLYISFVMMISLVQMKPTLILFGLLYFMIPNKLLIPSYKFIFGLCVLVISVGIYLLWGKLFIDQNQMYIDFSSPSEQINYMLKYPLSFLRTVKNTISIQGFDLLWSQVGKFGLLNRNISFISVIMYYLMTIVAMFVSPNEDSVNIKPFHRWIAALFMLLFILLNFVALYQIWSPVGSDQILGLQGRYFIPMGVVSIFLMAPTKFEFRNKNFKYLLVFGITLFLTYTILFIIRTYS